MEEVAVMTETSTAQRAGGLQPASARFAALALETIAAIETTQMQVIEDVADRCAEKIARGGLVHLFGSGHSRIAVEEMFPRYGSFPGFHPIVELSLSHYHQVVGTSGIRQSMFIENTEGLGAAILRNFQLDPELDLLIVISSGGINVVPIELAAEARRQGIVVVGITSLEHGKNAPPRLSDGSRLADAVDIVIDTCTPPGDAGIWIEGLEVPVGPLSTLAGVTIINMIKVGVAERLVAQGIHPNVITSTLLVGQERAAQMFDAVLEDYRLRRQRL
jgi:uncharacterized phosphosugar-binding protein